MPAREEELLIDVGEGSIDGTLFRPDERWPGALFLHGWGGSQRQYLVRARAAATLGCVSLTVDLSGHARTQPLRETVSREANLRDALAAYDVLAQQPQVDPDAIAVIGSSYGGYLAAILTTLRPVKWLALRAPALYIDTDWELPKLQLHKSQDLVNYRGSFVHAGSNRALRACLQYRGDVLIVESEHDQLIPRTVIASYREACTHARSLTYRCIEGADHGLGDEASQLAYTSLLTKWLREMLEGARRGQ